MARLCVTLTGTSPLVFHNPRLADPEDEFAAAIKEITDKRKKTIDDRRAVGRLEWYGGIYTVPGIDGLVVPSNNIKQSFYRAATQSRQGADIDRSIFFLDAFLPVLYEGPRDIDKLFADARFHFRHSVGVGRARTIRVRPCVPEWRIEATVELIEDLLDPNDFARIAERAGVTEGLCDARKIGRGRYRTEVKPL